MGAADHLMLANSLTPLYPKDGEEKRLWDAMFLARPRTSSIQKSAFPF
jgi:hypothetical protein